MADPVNGQAAPERKRRVRYGGKNPRRFEEKYKEHAPERYPDDVAKIMQGGKTPAGTHRPICVQEILDILDPRPGQVVLDATLGYGGHARELLARLVPGGCLWGIDVDPIEIKRTEARLRALGYGDDVLKIRRMNFAGMPKILADAGGGFDAVLADLGISSMQLDDPARGFTFKQEGPLDLRLNPERGEPASALIAALSENDIEIMLAENSDEPHACGIAKSIFRSRARLLTTTALADAVRRALPRREDTAQNKDDIDRSIRRTFQALRIAVNNEFFVLEQFFFFLPGCLKPGGKAAVLTFHSGEDTRVVRAFESGCASGIYAAMNREPIRPGRQEQYDNPRSKSAIVRWVERASIGVLMFLCAGISRVSAEPVPAHARVDPFGPGWVCEEGFHQEGNACAALAVPEHAKMNVLGNGWDCESGYVKDGNICVPVRLPEHARMEPFGNDWACFPGFFKKDKECVPVPLPPHAQLDSGGNDWECAEGYGKNNGACRRLFGAEKIAEESRYRDAHAGNVNAALDTAVCVAGYNKCTSACAQPWSGSLTSAEFLMNCSNACMRGQTDCNSTSADASCAAFGSACSRDCPSAVRDLGVAGAAFSADARRVCANSCQQGAARCAYQLEQISARAGTH
ncbi:MAG: 16S rRNA (cytosine(1402)-N(4))-methyltransferase RsmH [Candidatus Omnitrophica bacterium]|nr:16S rRNA (cytosine(1402)-N(4))-methyltransferase RsmH [Candidatus Omnitrophota bacterium]